MASGKIEFEQIMVEALEAWTGSGPDRKTTRVHWQHGRELLSLFRMQKGCWSETYYFAERGNSEEQSKQARLSDTRNPIARPIALGRGSSRAEGVNEALHIFTEGRKNIDKILEVFTVEYPLNRP
jgi:hypothetical protein